MSTTITTTGMATSPSSLAWSTAGSGALMLIVLSTISSVPLGLAYIAIFGAGSIASMAAMSTLIGLPFARANQSNFGRILKYAAAVVALIVGAELVYDLGVVKHVLFL